MIAGAARWAYCSRMDEAFALGRRGDDQPMRLNESAFSFLDRSARGRVAEYRRLVNEWIDHLPSGRADVIGRLRSGKDDQFAAAMWELFLHEAYCRSGFTVTVHPTLEGTTTQPDFLIEKDGARFYLEAVRASDTSAAAREAKLLAEVQQALSAMRAERFTVHMGDFTVGPRPLRTASLKKELTEWVAGLDYARAVLVWEAGNRGPAARHRWQHDGWLLDFAAFVAPESGLGRQRRMIRSFSVGGFVDDVARISVALNGKASRYGSPDAPLVIAVLCNMSPGVVDLDDVEEALYGGLIGRHAWGTSPPAAHSVHRPGLWCAEDGEWRRGHIPQVITAENVLVLGIPVCEPRLWSTLEPGVGMPEQP